MAKTITNFAGSTRISDLAKLGNAETRNMFVELSGSEYASSVILRGIPGFTTKYALSGTARGVYRAVNGKVFAAVGSKLYCNGSFICNISNTNTPVSFAETGGHSPYVLIADGIGLYAIDTTKTVAEMGVSVKNIEVPNDPWESTAETPVPGKPIAIAMVYEHPMLLLKNTDRIYMGYQYPWEWQPSEYYEGEKEIRNFNADDLFMLHWKSSEDEELFPEGKWISSDYSSDIAHSMCKYKGKLVVTGDKSVQAFSYIGGDFVYGDVFSCNQDSCAMLGSHQNSLVELAGHYCFTGKDGVYVDGAKVSDDFVDRKIKSSTFISATGWQYFSHQLYIIHMSNYTLAYDISNAQWITLSSNSSGTGITWRYRFCSEDVLLDVNGAVVEPSESVLYEHDGTAITRGRRGGIICSSLGHEIQLDSLRIVTNSGQAYGPAVLKVVSDVNLEDTRIVDGGNVGDFGSALEWWDFGTGRFFDVEFYTSNCEQPFAIYGLEIDAKECV